MRPKRLSRGPSPQLLFALFAAGMVLFNFPMLIVFDRDTMIFGLPLLPTALFTIWGLLIGALAWAMERRAPPAEPTDRITRPPDAATEPPDR